MKIIFIFFSSLEMEITQWRNILATTIDGSLLDNQAVATATSKLARKLNGGDFSRNGNGGDVYRQFKSLSVMIYTDHF
jgi:hypothetical protein